MQKIDKANVGFPSLLRFRRRIARSSYRTAFASISARSVCAYARLRRAKSRLDFIENRIGIRQRGELVVCYKQSRSGSIWPFSLSFFCKELGVYRIQNLSFMRSPDSKIALNSLICAEKKLRYLRSQDRYKSFAPQAAKQRCEAEKQRLRAAITFSHSL